MDNFRQKRDTLTERASDYESCMQKIRAKWGTDFEVVFRRTVTWGGFLGFWEKQGVELEYVLKKDSPYRSNYIPQNQLQSQSLAFDDIKQKVLNAASVKRPEESVELKKMTAEIKALREIIEKGAFTSHINSSQKAEHKNIAKIREILEKNEFTPSYIAKLTERIRKEFSLDKLDDYELLQETVVNWIGESIYIDREDVAFNPSDMNSSRSYPRIVILVGPTGVGKTTTLAKFVANAIPRDENFSTDRFHIISMDSYRIKAAEQLKTYADYMEIPFSQAESLEDLEKLVAMFRDKTDLFFVDTLGISPNDYAILGNLRKKLDLRGIETDVYLTLSATTRVSDMREIIKQFSMFDYRSIIVSKFDETQKVGSIISVLSEKEKPVSYITIGQTVPKDIKKATVLAFLQRIDNLEINGPKIEKRFDAILDIID
ncbi:MAG: hypothetical protein GX297_03685 [Treponema sp.]|nr:hypothetical protein [Treponema sp.]